MADNQGKMHGVIKSPMEEIFGNPSDYTATGGATYSGVDGYPKADDGIVKEVIFDKSGAFADVKPAKS